MAQVALKTKTLQFGELNGFSANGVLRRCSSLLFEPSHILALFICADLVSIDNTSVMLEIIFTLGCRWGLEDALFPRLSRLLV